jgi:hypothetical protein
MEKELTDRDARLNSYRQFADIAQFESKAPLIAGMYAADIRASFRTLSRRYRACSRLPWLLRDVDEPKWFGWTTTEATSRFEVLVPKGLIRGLDFSVDELANGVLYDLDVRRLKVGKAERIQVEPQIRWEADIKRLVRLRCHIGTSLSISVDIIRYRQLRSDSDLFLTTPKRT